MNLKNKWKRFWTMDVHNHEGFTLVELIIVIAILAILSSVAVVGYSSYVTKANKQADLTLIAEIQNALLMAYYADTDGAFKGTALVGISADNEAEAYDEFAAAALENAYGANWQQVLKLQYTGWTSKNVEGSRFDNYEVELLDLVDYLTTSLEKPLNAFVGDNFQKFMDENGIDKDDEKTVSNAAVLYVANNTANLTPAQQEEIVDIFEGAMTSGGIENVLANVTTACNGDLVTAAAAMYAIATAYSRYSGYEFSVDFDEHETPESAGAEIKNKFAELARKDRVKMKEYLEGGSVAQDLKAYMDILSTADKANGQIIGNLGSLGTAGGPTWTSTYTDIFVSYNSGGVFVFLELDENGVPVVGTTLVED